MKRRVCSASIVLVLLLAIIYIAYSGQKQLIQDERIPLSVNEYIVNKQPQDINIIPDKYNTGAKEPKTGWTEVGLAADEKMKEYNGVTFIHAANNDGYRVNFYNYNVNLEGTFTFENMYFSSLSFMKTSTVVDRNINFIFNNCCFGGVNLENSLESNVHVEFNNCTMQSFYGINADLNNCYIGGSYEDGLRLFGNVNVNNCYICDRAYNYEKVYHTDGVQIYGLTEQKISNINFMNCRFELPQTKTSTPSTYINASLMVQLEYGDASDFTFDNCYLNSSGSYAIYAWDKNKGLNLSNINFSNIKIGCLSTYGNIYPSVSEGVNIDYNTVVGNTSIYVASVFKENEKCYLSVSNDTNIERNFRVYTSSGKKYDFTIEACPAGEKIANTTFEEFPFDKLYEIPENCDWLVCFEVIKDDATGYEKLNQIRYENWTDDEVVLEIASYDFDKIIDSGSCGNEAEWELLDNGELHIGGEGSTNSYTSGNVAPWYEEHRKMIRKIVIEDGITSIGNQNFRQCVNVTDVEIADTVETLGDNTFIQCNSLTQIDLPASIVKIGKSCFSSTPLKVINYLGTEEQWNNIYLGVSSGVETVEVSFEVPKISTLASGTCGDLVTWELLEDGTLILAGEGGTYNYSSAKCAPWYEAYRDKITSVVIQDGITGLGTQLFRNCTNLINVEISDSTTTIGNNAFIKCNKLQEVHFTSSVRMIGKYAFAGTNIQKVDYTGTKEQWKKIDVQTCNDSLLVAELIIE